jgi:acetyltransferase-like isoleucine patch superfamily enzyme
MKEKLKQYIKSNEFLYTIIMILTHRKTLFGQIKLSVTGRSNKIYRSKSSIFINSKFDIKGNNNKIQIDAYCKFSNVTFYIRGNDNEVKISKNVFFNRGGLIWVEDNNCIVDIHENTTFEDTHIAVTEPGSKIIIGKDCMFAYDIDIRTGDSHSIIDVNTNNRINYAGNVLIDDHVWVASHCSILKGVELKKNTIVATRSLVTKSFNQEGIIIGGVPAEILKTNITWDRNRIYDYEGRGNSPIK